MEITQNSRLLSPTGEDREPQPLSVSHRAQFQAERDEGGLDLGQLFAAVRRRALIVAGVTTVVTSAALAWGLTRTATYEAKFQLLVEPITAETQVLSSLREKALTGGEEAPAVDDSEIQILLSPKLLSPVVRQLQDQYPNITYDLLTKNLEVTRLDESQEQTARILEVTYQDPDPKKVQLVLEQVADVYLEYSLAERQTDAREGIRFVEEQLPHLRLQVETLQEKLQTFRQGYKLLEPEARGRQLSEQINAIEGQKLDTQARLAEAQSLYATLQKQLRLQPDEAIAASVLSEAPEYQKLRSQLREVESQIAKESVRFTEDSPTLQALRDQRQKLLPLLNQEAQLSVGNSSSGAAANQQKLAFQNSVRLGMTKDLVGAASQSQVLKARAQAITQAENRLKQEFEQLPGIARQYDGLQQRLEIAKNNLNQFLAKREALRIDAAQKEIPWELIAPPSAPIASLPSILSNLTLGVLLGLLSGIGVALLVDRLRDALHTPQDVKAVTRLPLLGTIPFQKQPKELVSTRDIVAGTSRRDDYEPLFSNQSRQYDASLFLEAFRSLYTNIRFLKPDAPIRSLVISSAAPGEGKSTVAMHLAQAAAAMGQRVLLVDTDLRYPQIRDLPGLNAEQGLSNVVCTDLAPEAAIQQSPYDRNFFVLTAGTIPPDPTELLSSRKMQNLMEQLQRTFDLVIYDTPPLGFADAHLLAAHADGLLVVTRLGMINRTLLMQTLERLEIFSAPILGVVVTGAKEGTGNPYYVSSRSRKTVKTNQYKSSSLGASFTKPL